MILDYVGVKEINGSLIVLDDVENASYEEMVDIRLDDGSIRHGRIVQTQGKRCVVQVFEGTKGMSLDNARTRLKGHPMELALSPEIMGRVFNGSGTPIDGLGDIYPTHKANINGTPINPVSRIYPQNYINTGISTIDTLMTLIRGQKLPIFSGSGMKHNELAVQIVRQAQIAGAGNKFGIVFAAMGVKNDVAEYFRKSFDESGVLERVVMFLNLANDPIIERTLTPRCALTAAEYLAFELDMHILVIMTDMTSYAEALREFSSSKGEIPGRKGYPGYLYSDLASLYERAGMIKGKNGSVTQIPILTMPNDDITHPIPDLTGYITEGQIVLDRSLEGAGLYPPVSVLPSLSRLMKDGIGEGFTRADHSALSNQLFAAYAKVMDARSLASVIGEEELSPIDKKYIEFGKLFEAYFVNQGYNENRTIEQSLDLGWKLLSTLPREELDRVDDAILDKYYIEDKDSIVFETFASSEKKMMTVMITILLNFWEVTDMAVQAVPTKGNLMATKKSLALAKNGFELLDKKRNILIREMMMLIDKASEIQDKIDSTYHKAYKALEVANITLGFCDEISKSVPEETSLKLSYRSVMGVEIPIVTIDENSNNGIYFSISNTNSSLDEAYLRFHEVKELTAVLAEVENSVYRLADAIKKTQKRANALKNVMIPKFEATVKFITEALEEKEREEFSRLKVIKSQKAAKANT